MAPKVAVDPPTRLSVEKEILSGMASSGAGLALLWVGLVGAACSQPPASYDTLTRADEQLSFVAGTEDQALLARLALSEETDFNVRMMAVRRCQDEEVLERVARSPASVYLREAAIERLTSQFLLADLAIQDEDWRIRAAASKRLEDAGVQIQVATRDPSPKVRRIALEEVENPMTLAHVALTDPDYEVREVAVQRLSDPGLLLKVATTIEDEPLPGPPYRDRRVRMAAWEKVNDPSLLLEIVRQPTPELEYHFDDDEVATLKTRAHFLRQVENRRIAFDRLAREDLQALAQDPDPGIALAARNPPSQELRSWERTAEAAGRGEIEASAVFRGIALYDPEFVRALNPEVDRAIHGACIRAIRQGDPALVPDLVVMLELYGTKELGDVLLNCGPSALSEAARQWAKHNNFMVLPSGGSSSIRWGMDADGK